MTIKLTVSEIEMFRNATAFLDEMHGQVMDKFDDLAFKQKYFVSIEQVKMVADRLGSAEITMKG